MRIRNPIASFCLWLAFSGAFLLAGIVTLHSGDPYKDGVTTTGTVIGESTSSDSDGDTYAPIVRFASSDGAQYTVTASFSTSRHPKIGSDRKVSYRPSNPDNARVLDKNGKWFSMIFVAVGVLVALFAVKQLMFPRMRMAIR